MSASCSMFSKILKLIPRIEFERMVKEHAVPQNRNILKDQTIQSSFWTCGAFSRARLAHHTFRARLACRNETALSHPLGRDPLLAGEHGVAAVQGAMIDLTAAVAIFEVDGIAALRRHFPPCFRKGRLAAVFHVVQVSDQRAHALAAACNRRSILGIRRH